MGPAGFLLVNTAALQCPTQIAALLEVGSPSYFLTGKRPRNPGPRMGCQLCRSSTIFKMNDVCEATDATVCQQITKILEIVELLQIRLL